MKNYKVSELQDGMQFSAPVFIDEESVLVPEGVVIRQKDIDRLQRWGIDTVKSDGIPVSDAQMEAAFTSAQAGTGGKLLQTYTDALVFLDHFYTEAEQGLKLDPDLVSTFMQVYYPAIKDSIEDAMGLTFRHNKTESRYAGSAINCMILSVAIGNRLKLPGHRLMNLAQGALLHDIGMTRIPKSILDKKGTLSPEEMKTMQSHTVYSYRIITKELGLSEEVGRIVLLHHERWDGKGYPKGLSAKEIPLSARIVSVTDAYEAMIRDKPYRGSMIGYKAVRQILNDNGRRFDSEILKVFIKSMGVYPPGSVVILQDGSIGKVVRNHRDVPLRPVVQILVAGNGEKIPASKQKTVDLLEVSESFIARAVHPGEVESTV